MAKKKHKPAATQPVLNDKNYLASGRARKLPVYKCEINDDWEEAGLAQILVYRQHVNKHLTVGIYLVDTFCVGVKDTFYYFNEPDYSLYEMLGRAPFAREIISYELAHNIIYGALAYAEDLGIAPDPAFKLTRQILEEDTENIPLIEVPFGRNGKPVLVLKPGDPRNDYYKRQLEKNLAPGEYEVDSIFAGAGDLLDDEDDEDYDAYYDKPELWEEEDWEDFIAETLPEELDLYITTAEYIYRKTTPVPAEAAPVIAAITQAPTFTVSDEALPNLTYNFTPEEQEEIKSLAAELDKQLRQLGDLIMKKLDNAGKDLKQLENKPQDQPETDTTEQGREHAILTVRLQQNLAQWPHNPVFHDQLIQHFQNLGLMDEADATIREFYRLFPDYLPAKIHYAGLLIDLDQPDQVMAVFNGQYSLSAVYPTQNTFAIADVVNFYGLMSRYFLKNNNIFLASYYVNLIEELDVPNDVPVDFLTIFNINREISNVIKPVLENARQDEAKKQELIELLMS